MTCSNVLAAAQAEHLLPSCSGLRCLRLQCAHVPSRFPPGLQHLEISLGKNFGASELPFDSWQPSVLLWQLVDLTSLETLTLTIKDSRVVLDCPVSLPQLKCLSIRFDLNESTVASLPWLRSQSCTELDVFINVHTPASDAHQALVDELERLPIANLKVCVEVALSAEVQTKWRQVSASKACTLVFSGAECGTLHAVPCSPQISVRCYPVYGSTGTGARFAVSQEALTQQAAKYCVSSMQPHAVMIEAGWVVPFEAEGLPWQLSIRKRSLRRDGRRSWRTRLLQNSAAVAAGWKDTDDS